MPKAKIAINSARMQTVNDFNIVIVDNGNCSELQNYIHEIDDPRIVLHSFDKILCIEENWERITKLELGTYMTIIGHDDEIYEEYLEQINELICKYPSHGLFGTSGYLVNKDGERLTQMKLLKGEFTLEDYLEARLKFNLDVSGTGFVFASKFFKENGGFQKFPKLFFSDDAFWLSLLQKGDGIISDKTCYNVMIHEGSASFTHPKIGITLAEGLMLFNQFLIDNLEQYKQKRWQSLRIQFMKKYFLKLSILVTLDDYNKAHHEKSFNRFKEIVTTTLGNNQILFDVKIRLVSLALRFAMIFLTPSQIMSLLHIIIGTVRKK